MPSNADMVAAFASAFTSLFLDCIPTAKAAPAIAIFSASIAGTMSASEPFIANVVTITGKAKECVPVAIMIGVNAAIIPTAKNPRLSPRY